MQIDSYGTLAQIGWVTPGTAKYAYDAGAGGILTFTATGTYPRYDHI